MYQSLTSPNAQKDLKKIDSRFHKKILVAIAFLEQEPFHGKKLNKGKFQRYTLRVWPYRIIYEIDKEKQRVVITRIGHRQGVYK